jgi:uncharacterized protein YqhQ
MPESTLVESSTTNNLEPARPYIGGQAVLEGVMMRAPTSLAVVVRRRDGSLHVRERGMPHGPKGWAKLPLARGVASLVESLRLGNEALQFSAELMMRDEDEANKTNEASRPPKSGGGLGAAMLNVLRAAGYTLFLLASTDPEDASRDSAAPGPRASGTSDEKNVSSEKSGSRAPMTLTLVFMVAIMIALPQFGAEMLNRALKLNLDVQSPAFQALTGGFKLFIVIGYLLAVRTVFSDIRRVFQYHGAEHKTISTYEARLPLTVENARKQTTLHPRCGTTFLVMVALVSIGVFTIVGQFLPRIHTSSTALDNVVFFFEKLPFLPLIAAVTFEIQRVFARFCTTGPLRALLWPGFLCQKITTIEPDDSQLEVALASLRVTLFRENGEEKGAGEDVRYANFEALMKAPTLRRAR